MYCDGQSTMAKLCSMELDALLVAVAQQEKGCNLSSPRLEIGQNLSPIPLNAEQEQATKDWAADDRLWTTQETVEFNLRTFARKVLALVAVAGSPQRVETKEEEKNVTRVDSFPEGAHGDLPRPATE